MAEGVFLDLIEKNNVADQFEVDSAGTAAYHVGELPDPRMRETALKNGIRLTRTARQFVSDDFLEFDYILAMDSSNYENMMRIKPAGDVRAKVLMMREFDKFHKGAGVPDPYYGGLKGFDDVFDILLRSNEAFLSSLS